MTINALKMSQKQWDDALKRLERGERIHTDEQATAEGRTAIEEAAYSALTQAGMIEDRDLLKLTALSAITVVDGVTIVPPEFIEAARKRIPAMFESAAPETDARKITASEFQAALKRMDDEDYRRFAKRSNENDLRRLAKQFRGKSDV
jgi:hypothetical protein